MPAAIAAAGWMAAAGCVPDIANDPVPAAVLEFDPQSFPPRVPEPTSLIVNPVTGKIDFSLAGLNVPDDCSMQQLLSPAQCEFYQYLESLDGYPTTTPGRTPASAALDPATLTAGTNVVVVAGRKSPGTKFDALKLGFDTASRYITLAPTPSWTVGEFYWAAVRGNGGDGVRAADGGRVVGSPTMALLKQDTPLPCAATKPAELDAACPAFALLSQSLPTPEAAAAAVFQLEPIRAGFKAAHAWELVEAAGIPKKDVGVLWGFPIHTSSVAELDPNNGLVPKPVAADEIHVAVQGSVDPATVKPFVFPGNPGADYGSVVFVDLTVLAASQVPAPPTPPTVRDAFPLVATSYADGNVIIKGQTGFVAGHQYGIFFLRDPDPPTTVPAGIRDSAGHSLVASPVSKLLTLRNPLLDLAMHSTVAGVSDANAKELEAGRMQLGAFFDSAVAGLIGLARETLVYCYAFEFQPPP